MPESKIRIGLLSDTHGYWDDRMTFHLESVDEIWHAGDVGDFHVMEKMSQIAPVKAVFGNIDDHKMRTEIPEIFVFQCLVIYNVKYVSPLPQNICLEVFNG